MKLEVGMYVRTKDGYISQYKYYDTTNAYMEKLLCIPLSNGTFANIEDIIKASYNIIDILEKGDYVNGQKVYYDEELDYLYVQCIDGDGNLYYESITKQSFIDNIKSIVTHEQMEQMSYKIKIDKSTSHITMLLGIEMLIEALIESSNINIDYLLADLKRIYLRDNKTKLFLTEVDKKKFTSDYIDNHNVRKE